MIHSQASNSNNLHLLHPCFNGINWLCLSCCSTQKIKNKNQFLSTNCRYIHKVLVLTWQAVGPDIRMYSLRPSNPNKIHTLQQYEALIRIKCIQVVVHYSWSLKVAGKCCALEYNRLDWNASKSTYYIKGRTQTSVFSFMSRVSIAELVYEVSKIDSPLINNDFTACTIVYVLPVPGIPKIRA